MNHMRENHIHTFEPVFNENSKVLILGTFPSQKSRENGFYYGHPKNRFWNTLEQVFDEKIGNTIEEKTNFLLTHHIALFDVIKECEISSSSDSSIKNATPNNLNHAKAQGEISDAIMTALGH